MLNSIKAEADYLKTIGNEHRLQIVTILSGGEQNVTAINKEVNISQPAMSQHLSKLKKAGIVSARREQREIFYSLKSVDAVGILMMATSAVKPTKGA